MALVEERRRTRPHHIVVVVDKALNRGLEDDDRTLVEAVLANPARFVELYDRYFYRVCMRCTSVRFASAPCRSRRGESAVWTSFGRREGSLGKNLVHCVRAEVADECGQRNLHRSPTRDDNADRPICRADGVLLACLSGASRRRCAR